MNNKQYIHLVNIVLVLLVAGIFFLKPGYLFFTDYVTGPRISIDLTSGWLYLQLIFSVLSKIISVAFLEKAVIAGLIYLLLASGNALAKRFSKNTLTIILVGICTLFNPFVYERMLYGQVGVLIGLSFCIFGIAYFFDFLNEEKYTHLPFAGLFFGLAILFSNHYLFIITLIVLVSCLCFWRKWQNAFSKKLFWKQALYALVVLFLINSIWIISTFASHTNTKQQLLSSITPAELQAFEVSGNSDFDALKLVTMMSGFWGKDQHRFFDITQSKQLYGRGFSIVALILLFGCIILLRDRSRRNLGIFILIIIVSSILLALGVKTSMTATLTEWLFKHVPFYVGMRETQKWVSVVVVGYAILLTVGLDTLFEKYIRNNTYKKIAFALIGLSIIMQAPLLLFGFAHQVTPTQYPSDWESVNQIMINEHTESCTNQALFLPNYSRK